MAFITSLAWVSIGLAIASSIAIVVDEVVNRPKIMPVMRVVWPITSLWSGVFGLIAYRRIGRSLMSQPKEERRESISTAVAATHCGSGCTLGDFVAETATIVIPLVIFGHAIFGTWVMDYIAAFIFGIAFQFFTIPKKRMPNPGKRLWHAVQADTASLTAWQVGMYGWMAIVVFAIAGHEFSKADPVFWFSMQIAMFAGFLTSLPVNLWLLRAGIKQRM